MTPIKLLVKRVSFKSQQLNDPLMYNPGGLLGNERSLEKSLESQGFHHCSVNKIQIARSVT